MSVATDPFQITNCLTILWDTFFTQHFWFLTFLGNTLMQFIIQKLTILLKEKVTYHTQTSNLKEWRHKNCENQSVWTYFYRRCWVIRGFDFVWNSFLRMASLFNLWNHRRTCKSTFKPLHRTKQTVSLKSTLQSSRKLIRYLWSILLTL